jgi:uncharacterized protein YbjT (DUF2867 family)
MLGQHVTRALLGRGHRVRALTRSGRVTGSVEAVAGDLEDPASLRRACAGAEVVVSCAGASMRVDRWRERRRFSSVDHAGNARLLHAARNAGVRRFVYVGVFAAERMMDLEYAAAHERFGRELAGSGLEWAIIKPTGLFGFFDELLRLAGRGLGPVVGDGSARTNPVHEADVAEIVADAVGGLSGEIPVGGPDVLTRREIAEMPFHALRLRPRLANVPAWVVSALSATAGLANPRIGALARFGAAVSQVDCIAPVGGRRRLGDHFRERAGALWQGRPSLPPLSSVLAPLQG